MKTITKPVYGPDLLKFTAEYREAENHGEIGEVVSKMGLTLKDVNDALRVAKKRYYEAALESTPQSRIDALVSAAKNTGAFSEDELTVMVDSIRAKVTNSLPGGLTPVLHPADAPDPALRGKQVIGKPRGRAPAEATAA